MMTPVSISRTSSNWRVTFSRPQIHRSNMSNLTGGGHDDHAFIHLQVLVLRAFPFTCTPRKISMEPKNHLVETENHLTQTSILGFQNGIFHGVCCGPHPEAAFLLFEPWGFWTQWPYQASGVQHAACESHGMAKNHHICWRCSIVKWRFQSYLGSTPYPPPAHDLTPICMILPPQNSRPRRNLTLSPWCQWSTEKRRPVRFARLQGSTLILWWFFVQRTRDIKP